MTFLRRIVLLLAAAYSVSAQSPPLQKITINYATRTGTSWPLYIAKEGGYFRKYGLDVDIAFAVHPAGIAMVVSGEAAMTNYPLEQAMLAGSKDGSLTIVASPYRKSLFALMADKTIASVRDLKGKRIGVSQIGDAPYNYAVGLLGKFGLTPRDVEWVPIGTDVNGRAAALVSGRVDATMLTAPVYFKLEATGYKSLANISDYDDIYAPTVYVFRKATIAPIRNCRNADQSPSRSHQAFLRRQRLRAHGLSQVHARRPHRSRPRLRPLRQDQHL